jgi:ribosome-associated heat shock protein Hsp15
MGDVRIDKWLWAARFFKTRGLAQAAIGEGKVLVGGERVKLARPARIGDEVRLRIGDIERTVRVLALSDVRGPAPVAQRLYEETEESVRRRVQEQARRALYAEPAHTIERGRPTKRDRRRIERMRTDGNVD